MPQDRSTKGGLPERYLKHGLLLSMGLLLAATAAPAQTPPPDRAEIRRVKAEVAACKDLGELFYYSAVQNPTRQERHMRAYVRRTASRADGVRGAIPKDRIEDAIYLGERANGNAPPENSRDGGIFGATDYAADCLAKAWRIPQEFQP